MGDLILHPASTSAGAAGAGGALIVHQDPEAVAAAREQRIKEAQVHEEKLRQINEELPTRIYNVAGSCAGAGSGDFHYYRQIRRAEQDRLRRLEAEAKAEATLDEFETKRQAAQAEMDARAAKKRAKRQKKKAKKKQKGAAGGGAAAADGAHSDSSGSDGEGEREAAVPGGRPPAPKQQDLD